MNKAQAIRNAFDALKDLDASAADIQAHVVSAHPGTEVAPAQISNIRTKLKEQKGCKAARKGGKEPAYTESELVGARTLAEKVGGVERAKTLIDILFRLRPSNN